jgi:endonuclease/exonuclease/phosphatase (EEP) superfamily protein YafD
VPNPRTDRTPTHQPQEYWTQTHPRHRSTRGADLSTARRVTSLIGGVGLLLVGTGALVARYVPIPGHRTLYAVMAAPFLIPAALISLLLFVWGRRWIMATVAAGLAVALVAPQVPWYVRADSGAAGTTIRAMTMNMLFGGADPESLLAVATENADVLLLQELTPEAVQGLTKAGIDGIFPHHAVDARGEAAGAAIYSRYPLTDIEHIPGYAMAMVQARLRPPGTDRDLTVVSMHFAAPWPQPIWGWHNDFGRFPQTLNELADRAGDAPILIGGDFNATIDMRPYRDLLTRGYRDAAEQAGAGRELTYPSNSSIPPLMGIDHFLTRNATAVSAHTVEVAGTDHRSLLTTVALANTGSAGNS